jgi:hypothetical protein
VLSAHHSSSLIARVGRACPARTPTAFAVVAHYFATVETSSSLSQTPEGDKVDDGTEARPGRARGVDARRTDSRRAGARGVDADDDGRGPFAAAARDGGDGARRRE